MTKLPAAPLRVLVVEDEAVQRQALAAMCRKALHPAPVETAEAADGGEAVRKAAAFTPNVVLMDIRMPGLDGLESARRLAAGNTPAPQTVFVTAYDDFDYAREALCLGAVDYLVKPVSLDELARVLRAASGRVDAARRAAGRETRMVRRLKAALPLLRQEAFRELIDGSLPCPGQDPALGERLNLAGVSGRPSLAMFFELEPGSGPRPGGLAEMAAVAQETAAALARLLRRRLGSAWLLGPAGATRLGLVCEGPEGLRAGGLREWSLGLAAALRAEAERVSGRAVSVGVGEQHPEHAGLVVSVREAAVALAQRARLGSGCLVHIGDVRADDAGATAPPLPSIGPLLEAVRFGQPEPAARAAATLAREMAAAVMVEGGPLTAGLLAAELATAAARAALDGGAEPAGVRDLEARTLCWALGNLEQAAAPDLGTVLTALARELAELTGRAQSQRQGGVTRRAIAYIQANFSRPLTLEGVAREVHVSHYYLSHLLRRESGRSFTDHLTELRMTRARELLASTDLSVSEVASRAGFADGNYFARVFRQNAGQTPSSYRRHKGLPKPG